MGVRALVDPGVRRVAPAGSVLADTLAELDAVLAVLRAERGISCHDFRTDQTDGAWRRTCEPVRELLRDNSFTLKPLRDDVRPWIRWYVYGQRTV